MRAPNGTLWRTNVGLQAGRVNKGATEWPAPLRPGGPFAVSGLSTRCKQVPAARQPLKFEGAALGEL